MLAFTGERLRFCGFVRQASSFLGIHRLPCALSESCLTRRARTRVQLSIVLSRRSEIFRFPKRKKGGGKKNERMQKRWSSRTSNLSAGRFEFEGEAQRFGS